MIAHQVGVAEKSTCQFHIESYHKGRSAESAMREESSRLGGNFPHDIYTKLTLTPTSMPTLNMKPNTDPNPDPNFNTKRNPDHDIDPDTELDHHLATSYTGDYYHLSLVSHQGGTMKSGHLGLLVRVCPKAHRFPLRPLCS